MQVHSQFAAVEVPQSGHRRRKANRCTTTGSQPASLPARGFRRLCSLLVCLVGIGCTRNEEITRYSVPRSSHEEAFTALQENVVPAASRVTTRMFAAILPRGRQTWFFKLQGPDTQVAALESDFEALIRSVRFSADSGEPAWELPEGWRQQPRSGMRFATLQAGPEDQPLELTVIPLTTGSGSLGDYVLANINRWREQLGLAKIASAESQSDTDSISQIPVADGVVATLVDLVGQSSAASAMAMSSGLPANHPPITGSELMIPAASAGASQIDFESPQGWKAGKVSGMRQAAFEVVDGEQKIEVTAINLPVSGGDRLSNVNRWRDQLGLPAITQSELEQSLNTIEVDGSPAEFVEIVGSESEGAEQAVLGAIIDRNQKTWFFKLMGDAELAQREREAFQEFVRSVKFRGPTAP